MASKDYQENFKKYSFEARRVQKNWKNFLKVSKLNDIDEKTKNLNLVMIAKKFNSFTNSNIAFFNKRKLHNNLKCLSVPIAKVTIILSFVMNISP